jgi:hypothetical protein
MDKTIVFGKTEKGEEEINTRKHGLPLPSRRVLILVDGRSDVSRLIEKGEGLPDIIETLGVLEKDGFIAPSLSVSRNNVKAEIISTVKQTLGTDADKVVKKIEKSSDSKEALTATIEDCKKLVKLTIDEKKAEEIGRKCGAIIAKM